jgi:hypothetical protein
VRRCEVEFDTGVESLAALLVTADSRLVRPRLDRVPSPAMARLRIGVEQLGAEGLRVELGGDDGSPDVIALAPGGGIRGRYEQDGDTIGLHAIRAETLTLSELSWGLSRGRVQGAARLHDVEIDAVIATGNARKTRPAFVGAIRARAVEATVDLRLGDATLHGATVRLDDFALAASEEGTVSVRVGGASASTIRGDFGSVEIVAQDVTAPDSLALEGGAIRLESIEVGRLDARVHELGSSKADKPAPGKPAEPRPALSLPFLDLLDGHVGVDVVTDVTVPILGRRKATHGFRIPIEGGVVDFNALERSLAGLEDLVIDFEVEGDKLILEKDIPLVPFDNVPLVQWSLDDEGIALAKKKKVRISALARPQLPPSAKKKADEERREKGSAVRLRRLDVRNIDVSLAVGGPFELDVAGGHLRFGAPGRPAIGELKVEGAVAHVPEQPKKGRLGIAARSILVEAAGVVLGGRRLDFAANVDAVEELVIDFVGLRPSKASTRLTGVGLRKVDVGPDR